MKDRYWQSKQVCPIPFSVHPLWDHGVLLEAAHRLEHAKGHRLEHLIQRIVAHNGDFFLDRNKPERNLIDEFYRQEMNTLPTDS